MTTIYTALLYFIQPLIWLRLWLRGRKAPAYRKRWAERYGYCVGKVKPDGIVLHSVSVGETLAAIPRIAPERAEPIARQLFLSIGGIGKAFRISDLLARQSTDRLMGDLSDFTVSEKQAEDPTRQYPVAMEREFLQAIASSDRARANVLLNDLLGHIFFLSGGDLR